MSRRGSLGEMLWPDDEESRSQAVVWAKSIVEQALDLVWSGFEQMVANELKEGPNLGALHPEQLERELTQWHADAVTTLWAQKTCGYASFIPSHEMHEFESRKGGKAMPPSYDLGFVHRQCKRWKLPVEAKILTSSAALAGYLGDIQKKYLPGVAAPWVGECGMIGYLLSGLAEEAFVVLQERLKQQLMCIESFKDRKHRTTEHMRLKAPMLRIHHMVMSCVPPSCQQGMQARKRRRPK